MPTPYDFATLQSKVLELARLDRDQSLFGANVFGYGHHYRFSPVLSEEELRGFERENEINLPDDYRSFLRLVGNGGAGPGYGLIPLEHSLDFAFISDKRHWLSTPFPYVSEVAAPPEDSNEDGFATTTGTLFLCDHGCGDYDRLVINGPARGSVWTDGLANDFPMIPLGLTFLEWYELWLVRSFEQLALKAAKPWWKRAFGGRTS